MWNFIKEHSKAFWNGFVGGGVIWGGVLFSDISHSLSLGLYFLRLSGAFVLAIATAIGTALATDLYKEKIRHKLFKKKTNGKQQDEERAA